MPVMPSIGDERMSPIIKPNEKPMLIKLALSSRNSAMNHTKNIDLLDRLAAGDSLIMPTLYCQTNRPGNALVHIRR